MNILIDKSILCLTIALECYIWLICLNDLIKTEYVLTTVIRAYITVWITQIESFLCLDNFTIYIHISLGKKMYTFYQVLIC